MKKQQHHKIISTILILAFAIGVLTCGEEDSGDLGLMWIPAGTFLMGSPSGVGNSNEEPQHQVTLTKGFYMSRYVITQSQYYLVTGEQPSNFINVDGDGRGRRPVETVNWYDAIVFCNKLSIKHGLQPVYSISKIINPLEKSTNPDDWGPVPTTISDSTRLKWDAVDPNWNANGYRLPTEAEWEYACRAGTTTPYNKDWNPDPPVSDPSADAPGWYEDSMINGSLINKTQEVGLKPPNAWGLYDMPGNVWEWCWDWYDENYLTSQATNPEGPPSSISGHGRVSRGGSWSSPASYLRSAFRNDGVPYDKDDAVGFRIVRP